MGSFQFLGYCLNYLRVLIGVSIMPKNLFNQLIKTAEIELAYYNYLNLTGDKEKSEFCACLNHILSVEHKESFCSVSDLIFKKLVKSDFKEELKLQFVEELQKELTNG